jgi:hypothetical protein
MTTEMVSSSSMALGAGVPEMVWVADFVGERLHARQPHLPHDDRVRAIALGDLHPPARPCSCLQEEDEEHEEANRSCSDLFGSTTTSSSSSSSDEESDEEEEVRRQD